MKKNWQDLKPGDVYISHRSITRSKLCLVLTVPFTECGYELEWWVLEENKMRKAYSNEKEIPYDICVFSRNS